MALTFSETVDITKAPSVTIQTAAGQTRTVTLTSYSGTSAQGSVTFQSGDDGQSTIQVTGVTDLAGNSNAAYSANAFVVDTTAPTTPVFLSPASLVNSSSYSLSIQGELNSTILVKDNGTLVQTTALSTSPKSIALTLTEGTHSLTAQLKDSAGNLSTIATQSVTVDITKPTITRFTMATPSPVSANTYSISLSFSETVDSSKSPRL